MGLLEEARDVKSGGSDDGSRHALGVGVTLRGGSSWWLWKMGILSCFCLFWYRVAGKVSCRGHLALGFTVRCVLLLLGSGKGRLTIVICA